MTIQARKEDVYYNVNMRYLQDADGVSIGHEDYPHITLNELVLMRLQLVTDDKNTPYTEGIVTDVVHSAIVHTVFSDGDKMCKTLPVGINQAGTWKGGTNPNPAQGQYTILLNGSSAEFNSKVGASDNISANFEIKSTSTLNQKLVEVFRFSIICYNLLDDNGTVSPENTSAHYTKIEAEINRAADLATAAVDATAKSNAVKLELETENQGLRKKLFVASGVARKINFATDFEFLPTNANQLKIKSCEYHIDGKLVSMPDTAMALPASPSDTANIARRDFVYLDFDGSTATYKVVTEGTSTSLSGHVVIPIATIQRYNTGAYHPKYNTNGTGRWKHTSASTNHEWWEAGSRGMVATSIADCFDPTKTVESVIGQPSGRPDGKLSDAIYDSMVKDLRTSALKKPDAEVLRDEFNLLREGKIDGWEPSYIFKPAPYTAITGGGNGFCTIYSTGGLTSEHSYFNIGDRFQFDYSGHTYQCVVVEVAQTYKKAKIINDSSTPINGANLVVTNFICTAHEVAESSVVNLVESLNTTSKDIAAVPIICDEKLVKYVFDGTSRAYKLLRRCSSVDSIIYSDDGGLTWIKTTTFSFNAIANTVSMSIPANRIVLISYRSDARALEYGQINIVTAPIGELGVVFASNHNGVYYGAKLCSDLTNKVPVNQLSGSVQAVSLATQPPYKSMPINQHVGHFVKNNPVSLSGNTSGVKCLPWLVTVDGVKYLNIAFSELAHNGTSFGDYPVIFSEPGVRSKLDTNGVRVVYGVKTFKTKYRG